MKKRKKILIIISVFLFTSVNIYFHLMEFWTILLLYIAIVNGVIIGFIAGHFSNSIFEKKEIKVRFLYIGVVVGMFLALLWVNNQISVEFYINKDKLHLMPPYINYFRFYLIGLSLGIIKSVYYAIVPSVLIFTGIGFFLEKIFKIGMK